MLRHYKGSLGKFAYDDSIFMIKSIACKDALADMAMFSCPTLE